MPVSHFGHACELRVHFQATHVALEFSQGTGAETHVILALELSQAAPPSKSPGQGAPNANTYSQRAFAQPALQRCSNQVPVALSQSPTVPVVTHAAASVVHAAPGTGAPGNNGAPHPASSTTTRARVMAPPYQPHGDALRDTRSVT